MTATTVLLCGVGGQGTILAADLLAHAAMAAGLDVKVSEIHGMAQRGGAVTTVVRFGDHVDSMVSDRGCADVVVSFETTEALRNQAQLKQGGALIVNDESIKPLPVLTGKAAMPARARQDLEKLGALSARLGFPIEAWEDTVAHRVPPKTVEVNLEAFRAGRAFVTEGE